MGVPFKVLPTLLGFEPPVLELLDNLLYLLSHRPPVSQHVHSEYNSFWIQGLILPTETESILLSFLTVSVEIGSDSQVTIIILKSVLPYLVKRQNKTHNTWQWSEVEEALKWGTSVTASTEFPTSITSVLLRSRWQLLISRLWVVVHLCSHLLPSITRYCTTKEPSLQHGDCMQLHPCSHNTVLLCWGEGLLSFPWKVTGYLATIASDRPCHWVTVRAQLAHGSRREGNTWHRLQLTTAGLKSWAAEGPCLWLCIPAAWMQPPVCVKGLPSMKPPFTKLLLTCLWNSFLWLNIAAPLHWWPSWTHLLSVAAVWGRESCVSTLESYFCMLSPRPFAQRPRFFCLISI